MPFVGCVARHTPLQTRFRPHRRKDTWGEIQGWILVIFGFLRLAGVRRPLLFSITLAAIVLGISILRKNRLILPLMAALIIVQTLWSLSVSQNRPDPYHISLIVVVIWSLYFAYYYRRKDEFVRWL